MANTRMFGLEDMILQKPAIGTCRECGVKHKDYEPHNKDSLFYQIKFKVEHGRWPTWEDACSHLPDDIRDDCLKAILAAIEEMRAHGIEHG